MEVFRRSFTFKKWIILYWLPRLKICCYVLGSNDFLKKVLHWYLKTKFLHYSAYCFIMPYEKWNFQLYYLYIKFIVYSVPVRSNRPILVTTPARTFGFAYPRKTTKKINFQSNLLFISVHFWNSTVITERHFLFEVFLFKSIAESILYRRRLHLPSTIRLPQFEIQAQKVQKRN